MATPTPYIQPQDYAAYGVPAGATAAQVLTASQLLDAYLKRPEGLLYGVDANGAPSYMLNESPTYSLTLAAPIVPSQVAQKVAVTGPQFSVKIGDVVMCDVADNTKCEALVVLAIDSAGITFKSAQYAHAIGGTLSGGLLIVEERKLPQDRPITRTSRTPIANMPAGTGRYGYQRRGDDYGTSVDTFNLLAVMSTFGGPPAWEVFIPDSNNLNPDTGEVWIPAGILLSYYTDVRMSYVSGFTYDSLPGAIKIATAQLVGAVMQGPLIGNVKAQQAGGTKLEWFAASQMSDDVKLLVDQYCLKGFY